MRSFKLVDFLLLASITGSGTAMCDRCTIYGLVNMRGSRALSYDPAIQNLTMASKITWSLDQQWKFCGQGTGFNIMSLDQNRFISLPMAYAQNNTSPNLTSTPSAATAFNMGFFFNYKPPAFVFYWSGTPYCLSWNDSFGGAQFNYYTDATPPDNQVWLLLSIPPDVWNSTYLKDDVDRIQAAISANATEDLGKANNVYELRKACYNPGLEGPSGKGKDFSNRTGG